ncbi:MAG: YjfB family protein [Lachnospiraceae bacterium]|nr:YjfB family protein [Lachnospiraceae bacterium]
MDIARLSMNMSRSQTLQNVGVALLDNALEVQKIQDQGIVDMIESAPSPSLETLVNPSVGQHIDLTV